MRNTPSLSMGSDEILKLGEGERRVDTKTQARFEDGRVSEPTSWTAHKIPEYRLRVTSKQGFCASHIEPKERGTEGLEETDEDDVAWRYGSCSGRERK